MRSACLLAFTFVLQSSFALGENFQPLEITVECQEEYVFGAPFEVTVILANQGDSEVTREEPDTSADIRIITECVDDDSFQADFWLKPPPVVRPIRRGWKGPELPAVSKKVTIRPGGEYRFPVDLAPRLTWNRLIPGQWLVSVNDTYGGADNESAQISTIVVFNKKSVTSMLSFARDKEQRPILRYDAAFWLKVLDKELRIRPLRTNAKSISAEAEKAMQNELEKFEQFWKTSSESQEVKDAIREINTGKLNPFDPPYTAE